MLGTFLPEGFRIIHWFNCSVTASQVGMWSAKVAHFSVPINAQIYKNEAPLNTCVPLAMIRERV